MSRRPVLDRERPAVAALLPRPAGHEQKREPTRQIFIWSTTWPKDQMQRVNAVLVHTADQKPLGLSGPGLPVKTCTPGAVHNRRRICFRQPYTK